MKKILKISTIIFFYATLLTYAALPAGTNVFRCVDGCTIHVVFQIGVEGTNRDVARVTQALKDCWERQDCKIPCAGDPSKSCKITVNVEVKKWSKIKNKDKAKYHHITMVNDGRSPSVATMGTPNVGAASATFVRGRTADEYCHEVGHLGGLKDKYCGLNNMPNAKWTEPQCQPPINPCCTLGPAPDRCTRPCPGAENDIMAAIPNKVTCNNIIAIVAAAGLNSCPTVPCCPPGTLPRYPMPKAPSNGARKVNTTPQIQWEQLQHAKAYRITLYKYDDSEVRTVVTPNLAFNIEPGVLEDRTLYKWRVQAIYENDELSDWSWFSYFETEFDYFVNPDPTIGSDLNDGLYPLSLGSGFGPKLTIQSAIDVDNEMEIVVEGHDIHLAPGNYQGIEINKPVSLIGEDPGTGEPFVFIHGSSPAIISTSDFTSVVMNANIMCGPTLPGIIVSGLGNLICTNTNFYLNGIYLPACPPIYAMTIDGHNTPGFGKLFFNRPRCAPGLSSLALWLDPAGLQATDDEPVDTYQDNAPPTSPPEDFVMPDERRMPKCMYEGLNGFPGLKFYDTRITLSGGIEYGWGDADVMQGIFHPEITSSITDLFTFDNIPKSLLLVLMTPDEETLQKRQVLFEAGETTSGYNVYIKEGKVCFGIWNRLERLFIRNETLLSPYSIYLLQLEYNGQPGAKEFRSIINGLPSPTAPFSGLTRDPDDADGMPSLGLGGEVKGTRFHDFNIRTDNYAYPFTGYIGDVMLYNAYFGPSDMNEIYLFLGDRYNQSWIYPGPLLKDASQWTVFRETETREGLITPAIAVIPNPFGESARIEIILPEKQALTVELIGQLGAPVGTLYSGEASKGLLTIYLDSKDFTAGFYLIKARGEHFMQTEKVVIIK